MVAKLSGLAQQFYSYPSQFWEVIRLSLKVLTWSLMQWVRLKSSQKLP